MTPERYREVGKIFRAAAEIPPDRRAAFLDAACGEDQALRQEVESLFLHDAQGEGWIDGRALDVAAQALASKPHESWVGRQVHHYQVSSLLAHGGMGEVYKAKDTRLLRTVAVKVLPPDRMADPDRRRRFLQEARAASALNHPNIVIVYDISNEAGTDFLVLEYVPGKTLRELIPPDGLPLDKVSEYGIQIASGLGAAHAAGIVHRDIKPGNIMITPESRVKILDFGIAKLTEPGDMGREYDLESFREQTAAGVVVGTVAYMSPEQARGDTADSRSDIFSMGCVLYQAATGQQPFGGMHALAIAHEIATADPLPPSRRKPNLPKSFDDLIAKCLRKDPRQRFQTMAELATALGEARSGSASARIEGSPSVPSIAVLPFANMSLDPENEFFGDGLAEELINELNRIDGLRVTARTSAFAFRGKALDVREIGRALNVGTVLEGSVRRAGNRLRVTAQLVNVADGYHLWSERYDREITDVFEIQDEISRSIVAKLRGRLLGQSSIGETETGGKRPTADPEAYNLFLKGRYYWSKRLPEMTKRAIECFEQAVARDPRYALAYAFLAESYNALGGGLEGGVLPPQEAFRKSRAYAEQSLRLDADLGEGHTALGYALLHFAWDLPAAEKSFREAIRLKPRYAQAHHWYSHMLAAAGRFDESLAESKAYLDLEPADPRSATHLSWHYLMAQEFDNALAQARDTIRDDPSYVWNHVFFGWALLSKGASAQAAAEMVKAVELSGGPRTLLTSLAHAHAVSGSREEALRILDRVMESAKQKYVAPYEIGMIHEALGNIDEALQWWERAYEERSPWLVYLAREPRLRHMRGQPKFDAFLGKVLRDLRLLA